MNVTAANALNSYEASISIMFSTKEKIATFQREVNDLLFERERMHMREHTLSFPNTQKWYQPEYCTHG